jgi:hypothetical protein
LLKPPEGVCGDEEERTGDGFIQDGYVISRSWDPGGSSRSKILFRGRTDFVVE